MRIKLIVALRLRRAMPFVFLIIAMGCLDQNSRQEDYLLPKSFPETYYPIDRNPYDEEKVSLGKKLFFEPKLSRDASISCNNCHQQQRAFADAPHHRVSVGVDDRKGKRNAPALQNLAYIPEFAWDGGVTHLDFTITNAITADFEMDQSMVDVVDRLSQDPEYVRLFQKVWDSEISGTLIQLSIAQFLLTLVSADSEYDRYRQGNFVLDSMSLAGEKLFKKNCSLCHQGELFSDFDFYNNGIDTVFADSGRARITNDPNDLGKFRVPSLRNIKVTGPYMHDGRFNDLTEVIEHYSTGIVESNSLDSNLRPLERGFNFNELEKVQLQSFLNSLTDERFLNNEKFYKSY